MFYHDKKYSDIFVSELYIATQLNLQFYSFIALILFCLLALIYPFR